MPTLSTRHHARNQDLLEALDRVSEGSIEHMIQNDAEIQWNFLEGEVDIALASPLLFAKREADLVLLEGACVAALGATGELRMQFRQGLRNITSVGYYGAPGIETMLAEIILKEKYKMHPRFLPVKHAPAEAIAMVDALLFPIESEHQPKEDAAFIDIIDEWFDMTQLPFVREVFVAWESHMTEEIDSLFRLAGDEIDVESLIRIDEQMAGRGTESNTEALPAHYRYRFTDDAQEGLKNFFQMAFFHGLHRDIPSFMFWAPDEMEH
jgi:predicted solute-binding protein